MREIWPEKRGWENIYIIYFRDTSERVLSTFLDLSPRQICSGGQKKEHCNFKRFITRVVNHKNNQKVWLSSRIEMCKKNQHSRIHNLAMPCAESDFDRRANGLPGAKTRASNRKDGKVGERWVAALASRANNWTRGMGVTCIAWHVVCGVNFEMLEDNWARGRPQRTNGPFGDRTRDH